MSSGLGLAWDQDPNPFISEGPATSPLGLGVALCAGRRCLLVGWELFFLPTNPKNTPFRSRKFVVQMLRCCTCCHTRVLVKTNFNVFESSKLERTSKDPPRRSRVGPYRLVVTYRFLTCKDSRIWSFFAQILQINVACCALRCRSYQVAILLARR